MDIESVQMSVVRHENLRAAYCSLWRVQDEGLAMPQAGFLLTDLADTTLEHRDLSLILAWFVDYRDMSSVGGLIAAGHLPVSVSLQQRFCTCSQIGE